MKIPPLKAALFALAAGSPASADTTLTCTMDRYSSKHPIPLASNIAGLDAHPGRATRADVIIPRVTTHKIVSNRAKLDGKSFGDVRETASRIVITYHQEFPNAPLTDVTYNFSKSTGRIAARAFLKSGHPLVVERVTGACTLQP